jgi:O-antigen/teichoic acid export membrane protein
MGDSGYPSAFRTALRGHAAFRFISLLLGFGFQIMVVKVLSPENYATYAILLATLLVGERLLSFGVDRTILRFVPALLLREDRRGLRFLAKRLGMLRAIGLVLFLLVCTASLALHLRVTPSELDSNATIGFVVWFIAYTLIKDSEAVAQSLIVHHWAALIAACEAFFRLGSVTLIYLSFRSVDVGTLVILYAATSSAWTVALWWCVWRSARRRPIPSPGTLPSEPEVVVDVRRQARTFGVAAYASTLSYLISSPGIVRLVAQTGLGINALAAFSFVQGISTSLSSGLPGQLILPSLESIAAKMSDSGSGDRVFPALSVLFKIELTFMLAIVLATVIGGPELIRILSRPAYAPYYYVLPMLCIGLSLQTIYRVLEILGSVNLKTRVFLSLWPLSVVAMAALYLTVGTWGLISVLVIPIAEIGTRVATLTVAFRRYGIWKVLDPVRSLRLVASAAGLLLGLSYALVAYRGSLGDVRLLVAVGGVIVFLSTLLLIRPLRALECETLLGILPASWTFPRYVARRLSRA